MPLRFVIHEHDATRLHWDLRLEMDGALKSWAIPKEPPSEINIKRLAIPVDDHNIDYIDFEGVIPEGEYGAGTVKIWDRGEYELESRHEHKIVFVLKGQRLHGRFILLKTKDNNWLWFKTKERNESPDTRIWNGQKNS